MEKLQFISQENSTMTHLESIQKACEAGVKWVQLRIKDQQEEEVLKIAGQAREICEEHNAKLTINDNYRVARAVGAYGLHLGKEDMPLGEARKKTGSMILGGTANTFEDIRQHVQDGADYVGVGPYRFTLTKKKLSPVLGISGYQQLVTQCKNEGIFIPILAIGGLTLDDIERLMDTGIYGIAVSSLVVLAPEPKRVVDEIYRILEKDTYKYA